MLIFFNVLMNQNYFQFNNNKLYEDVRNLPIIHGERTSPQHHKKAQLLARFVDYILLINDSITTNENDILNNLNGV